MPNKELTTETRLLLAFVLVGIVLVGWNYIYKPPVVTPPVTVPAPATQTPVEAPKPEPATPKIAIEVPGQVQASQARRIHHRDRSLSRTVFESGRDGSELDSQDNIRMATESRWIW